MTNPGDDAGQPASPDSTGGASEPTSSGYEAPPIESQAPAPEKTDAAPDAAVEDTAVHADGEPTPAFESPAAPSEQPGHQPPAYGVPYQAPPTYDPSSGYPPPPGFPPPPQGAYPLPPGGYPPPPPGAYPPPPGAYPPPFPDPSGLGGQAYPPPPYGAPPPYGTPAAGYGAPGYPGYDAAPQGKTNSLAIASLVASLVGIIPFLCGVGSVIGIVLGVIALNQIRESGEGGRGIAIAGIAVGAATFLISVLVGIAMLGT